MSKCQGDLTVLLKDAALAQYLQRSLCKPTYFAFPNLDIPHNIPDVYIFIMFYVFLI